MPLVSILVATDERGAIGRDGGLPWHLPNDLKRFKALTMGKPIVMGRKTWDSIGRPLPGRLNVVITRQAAYAAAGATVAASLDAALAAAGERRGGLRHRRGRDLPAGSADHESDTSHAHRRDGAGRYVLPRPEPAGVARGRLRSAPGGRPARLRLQLHRAATNVAHVRPSGHAFNTDRRGCLVARHPRPRWRACAAWSRAATGREPSEAAARGEHAMTRHDDRKRIAAHRLPDGSCGARLAQRRGDRAVRRRLAGRHRAGRRVRAALERRRLFEVERNEAEVRFAATQQRDDRVDRLLDGRRRRCFRCAVAA